MIMMLLIIISNITAATSGDEVKIDYLGQATPGTNPLVFAPGIVSNPGTIEYAGAFSPDGRSYYFTRRQKIRSDQRIWVTDFKIGKWTSPRIADFARDHMSYEPVFSPDGKRLYFGSQRPFREKPESETLTFFWYLEKKNDGWSQAQLMNPILRSELPSYISIAADGSIYFGSYQHKGIRLARIVNGQYQAAGSVSAKIDAFPGAGHPYISPDQSYLLFDSRAGMVNYGTFDIFITFRDRDGSWTTAINIGKVINSPEAELCPSVSPDGKFLFFNRWGRNNESDIYWVRADFIGEMKKKALGQ